MRQCLPLSALGFGNTVSQLPECLRLRLARSDGGVANKSRLDRLFQQPAKFISQFLI